MPWRVFQAAQAPAAALPGWLKFDAVEPTQIQQEEAAHGKT
jgi:hypothetical protein